MALQHHAPVTADEIAQAINVARCKRIGHHTPWESLSEFDRAGMLAYAEEVLALLLRRGIGGNAAAAEIIAERRRQVEVEGWKPEHDDQHRLGELSRAAAAYAFSAGCSITSGGCFEPWVSAPLVAIWPWHDSQFNPKDPRRDLVRAGALIIAEIERIDRAAKRGVPA